MEVIESSVRYLNVEDTKGNQVEVERKPIQMTKEKQEYIKKLMFSALEDPRAKYEKVTMDDVENYWKTSQGC
jgi:hypothetical protein